MSNKQSRRKFLWLSTGTAALAFAEGCTSKPQRVEARERELRSPSARARPEVPGALVVQPTSSAYFTNRDAGSREMNWGPVEHLGDTVPNDRFYIHSRALPPRIDLNAWRLEFRGDALLRPRAFSLQELLAFPQLTVQRTLDCGANFRAFFPPLPRLADADSQWLPIGFTSWHYGAVGVADWTGVRLKDVLDGLGLKNAVSAKFTGLDAIEMAGAAATSYEQVIPIDKVLGEDTLLVHRMNGQPLPPDHGFPLRLLLSGWGGNTAVKWLGRIEVSQRALPHPTFQANEIISGPDVPQTFTPTVGRVRSALELDEGATVTPGDMVLRGRAWSGAGAIERVDISIEKLAFNNHWHPLWEPAWQQTRLLAKPQRLTWVRFEWPWRGVQAGRYRIMTRATDTAGNVQPAPHEVVWNQAGLGYNGHAPLELAVLPSAMCP